MRRHTTTQTKAVQIRAGEALINGTSRYPNERRDWWCLRGSRWRGVSGTSPGDDQ
jgi:hypothetical protein